MVSKKKPEPVNVVHKKKYKKKKKNKKKGKVDRNKLFIDIDSMQNYNKLKLMPPSSF